MANENVKQALSKCKAFGGNALRFLGRVFVAIGKSASHNLGLKLLSIVLALLLWSYVITANPDITRDKVLSYVDVNITGQAVLTSRNLALRTDVSAELGNVRARVSAPQANYGLVTDENVSAEIDLSNIRTIGRQRVTLKGNSVYGDVVQLWPEYIEIDVEELVQRYVPVNVELQDTDEASYWYSTRTNPIQLTVSGPESIVSTVSTADILLDVSGINAPIVRAEQVCLRNSQGEEITHPLAKSSSSAMVYLDVYPVKNVPITTDIAKVITGTVPVGYEVTGVSVSPDTAIIAAERILLDTIDELSFNKIDVTNKTASFTRTVNLPKLKGLKYASTEQVSVSVTIGEVDSVKTFVGIPLAVVGSDNAKALDAVTTVDVTVSGAYTRLETITPENVHASVDLVGLEAGEYDLPVYVSIDGLPDAECTAAPGTVTVQVQ